MPKLFKGVIKLDVRDSPDWTPYELPRAPVDRDRSGSKNLAKQNPVKLKELIVAWFAAAAANNVLPLDDRTAVELFGIQHPTSEPMKAMAGD